jgi:hypothetical protein
MTQKLLRNRSGMIVSGIIAIVFIFLSSLIWLMGALVLNKTFDAFGPWFAISDPRALIVSQQAMTAYAISIVIVDVLLLVWWGLSSQKRESQESPGQTYYG